MKLQTLKKRQEFLHVASSGIKAVAKGVVLQVRENSNNTAPRVGFTATKKLGNAVRRNRIKRRLRVVAEKVLPIYARPGIDYVIICRSSAYDRRMDDLIKDMKYALHATNTHQDK